MKKQISNVCNLDDFLPHTVSEVTCINCKYRWLAVRPSCTPLKDLECGSCQECGFVIETGQEI